MKNSKILFYVLYIYGTKIIHISTADVNKKTCDITHKKTAKVYYSYSTQIIQLLFILMNFIKLSSSLSHSSLAVLSSYNINSYITLYIKISEKYTHINSQFLHAFIENRTFFLFTCLKFSMLKSKNRQTSSTSVTRICRRRWVG